MTSGPEADAFRAHYLSSGSVNSMRETGSSVRRMVAAVCALLTVGIVSAQVAPPSDGAPPDVPRDYIERYRRMDGEMLRFCIHPKGITGDLDLAVAHAIGQTLLLEVEIYEVHPIIDIPGLAGIPISEDELFVYLTNHCDAFLGFTLGAGVYDPWVTISRPYVQTRFIAVTTEDGPSRLSDLPPGGIVGTTMLTEGDAQVGAYVRSLPEERRWRRFPYPHAPLLIERLVDGTVEVGVAWEPAVWFAADMLGAQVHEIPSDPVSLPSRGVGMVLRSDQLFVRDAVDSAIAALLQDGTLQEIYEQVGFPGQQP